MESRIGKSLHIFFDHLERLLCRRGKLLLCRRPVVWTRFCNLNYIFPRLDCSKDHKIVICDSVSLSEEITHRLFFIVRPDCEQYTMHMLRITCLRISIVGFHRGSSSLKGICHLFTEHIKLWNTRTLGLSWRGNISRFSYI